MKQIYMDHHATTPLDPTVLEAMMPFLGGEFGNPSSNTHDYGHNARVAVDRARLHASKLIGAAQPDEIIFTSGATEADNLALKGIALYFHSRANRNIITTAIEHRAILDSAARLSKGGIGIRFVKINSDGLIDLEDLERKIDSDTILISIQTANSEIGTIQPVRDIGAIAAAKGVLFHTDAVQALGRMAIDVTRDNIDMLSISAHKMYGPKGVGALYVRKGIKLAAMMDGGGHERGMRSGTLNVPGIVGLGKAAEIAKQDFEKESRHCLELRKQLAAGIESRIQQVILNGHREKRLPNNLNYAFSNVEGESLILACRQVALSSSSACTSGSAKASYVLKAIGVPDPLAHSSIRIGLGKGNTSDDVDLLVDLLEAGVRRLRAKTPLYDMAK